MVLSKTSTIQNNAEFVIDIEEKTKNKIKFYQCNVNQLNIIKFTIKTHCITNVANLNFTAVNDSEKEIQRHTFIRTANKILHFSKQAKQNKKTNSQR